MPKQHLRLILNGKSANRTDVRSAIEAVRAMGHRVTVRVTFEAGDIHRLAAEALQDHEDDPIDTLVSGGGDGTLHEIVDAILEATPGDGRPPFAFALLPLGTANDFAHHIQLDPTDVVGAFRYAVRADAKPTDVGTVNGRTFVNMATGGFGTQVTTQTDPNLKRLLGGAAYIFTGLNRFTELAACEARIEAEDFFWEGAFVAIAIGNGRRAGGGIRLCPRAKLDDGLLDLTIVPYPQSGKVTDLLGPLLRAGADGLPENLVMRRARHLSIHTAERVQFNLDGEPQNGQDWQIAIRQHQIDMRR
ncbi:lipid kinase YegS [Roseibium denhamense]|uniref:Lipid kinase YegS n=1 Tax=Roseibium denhamense TaxID=76305 RepID=A0ABY1PPC5_9HYPH|nr:lipid kinase YegS [Roseibium denhamense]MTI07013.1 lipid kinase YegS [Roseibium denhamense]SMP36574.1 lipid kinase YegS [Roseibium denhamense]